MLKAFEVTREDAKAGALAVAVFRVEGYLDAHTAPRFEEALRQAVQAGERHIIVDCGQLDYISSAGLGVLIETYRSVQPESGQLKVASMSPAIADIFDILGFSKVIDTYPTLDAALESFGPSAGG